ncbi:MAG: dinitrogenase iron-molybdenum cofactor biosynthesis protein [Oscillospiraceae bacterium]|nr:dinitrogenase iron-molybdenum cofactor biosynthesis protein [Oscillospiraceae bacterium]
MTYKIAFASSDGEKVDVHFGQAEKFYIAVIDTDKPDFELEGIIHTSASCHGGGHSESSFETTVSLLEDVSAVVVQRIGPGAEDFLREHGIRAYQIPLPVEDAAELIIEDRRWEADKWRYPLKN